MDDAASFRIGRLQRARVIVTPRRRAFTDATNYWDANLLYADVEIAAGAFDGAFQAEFRSDELAHFHEQLRDLYERLDGTALFDSCEGWLRIEIRGDGKGHFRATCDAHDDAGTGNRLRFWLDFDQTELPAMIRGLDGVCAAFPVVGSPR